MPPSGPAEYLGVSLGMAAYPEDGLSAEELLQKADKAMYMDKMAFRDNLKDKPKGE